MFVVYVSFAFSNLGTISSETLALASPPVAVMSPVTRIYAFE